jgi:3-deoxy-D-manno-octulosonate 8-phosphate phosphatase (KDO 8-P phosphatase)
MSTARLADIRLLVLDVDGVLTDGRIQLTAGGEESKSFHVRDGLGIKRVMDAGVAVALISGRSSAVVQRRADELGIPEVHQGVADKMPVLAALMERMRVVHAEVAVMGDDLPDLVLMAGAGFSATVADAPQVVRDAVDWVAPEVGGAGAVRSLCDLICDARDTG